MKNRLSSLLAFVFVLTVVLAATGAARAQTAADQARAIADILTVIESENAYAGQNCSYFSDVVNLCRSGPDCAGIGIPNYPVSSPEFIEGRLGRVAGTLVDEYVRSFVEDFRPSPLGPTCDPDSLVTYCYIATPWNLSFGRPSFMGNPGRNHLHRS